MKRPPIPDPPHKGGCLCGAVRYALAARPLGVNACHCDDCKKLTGAPNLLMLIADRGAFTHQGATERYTKRADSGRLVDIVRCAKCGVRMWHEPQSAPKAVFVAAGTLDDPHWVVPTSHIYTAKAMPGVAFEADAICLEGPSTDRETLMKAFDKVYPPKN